MLFKLGLWFIWYILRNAISGTYADGDAVEFKDCEVEVDLTPSASSYAAIDSWATEVSVDPEQVSTTDTYTFKHTGPITFTGNQQPVNIVCTVVYTEDTTDPYKNIKDHTLGAAMDIRWTPKGGTTGDFQFTSVAGKLISRTLPQGSSEGSGATTFQFTIRASRVTQGTHA